MRNEISEIAVQVCKLKKIIEGEKENDTKAPNMEKIKKSQDIQEPNSCVSGYMKSVKSRRYWSDCTLVHETDAPGL